MKDGEIIMFDKGGEGECLKNTCLKIINNHMMLKKTHFTIIT